LLAVALYGILHSLLASPPAKAAARRWLGTPATRLYRLAYNLIAAVTLLPVLAVPAAYPGPTLYRLEPPWQLAALAGQLAALGLLAIGLLQSDVRHFLGLRQLMESEPGEPPALMVKGLYRWVRHPLYTAGLIFLWLTPLMTTSLLAFNFGLSLYILIGSVFEERRLLAEFGQAYADYQKRVPRLIPGLRLT
jgi:protein-S-isoprenylcysteine O-methyltransferase Ste14